MGSNTPANQVDRPVKRRRRGIRLLALVLFALAGCLLWLMPSFDPDQKLIDFERHQRYLKASLGIPLAGTPDLKNLDARLSGGDFKIGAPVFMRIFKREFELELWMARDGKFERFATYPICRWSGQLGPKIKTGDRQAPEGFYSVEPKSLNPKSRWHRSFNLGFPNAFDRAHGRTGSFLMVHGGCGSVGCYAMTNPVIDEIWTIISAAFDGGQKRFQVQVLPFRMTALNLDRFRDKPDAPFWTSLKAGYDLFEAERVPPKVYVCGKTYTFAAAGQSRDLSGPIVEQCRTASSAGS